MSDYFDLSNAKEITYYCGMIIVNDGSRLCVCRSDGFKLKYFGLNEMDDAKSFAQC